MTPRARALAALGISVVTALVFWRAVSFSFLTLWDDGAMVEQNTQYRGFDLSHLWWMMHPYLGQFFPLTLLSWAVDWKLWGLSPAAFHRTNVLLHSANAGLLFLIARRLITIAVPEVAERLVGIGAGFAALVWALHPLRVESVAWVNERRDVLCGFFYLLAVLTYLKGVRPHPPGQLRLSGMHVRETGDDYGGWNEREIPLTSGQTPPTRSWLAASVLCFALAVMAKALAVTLPIALVLMDVYPLRRRNWREKIPYLLIALGGTVMAFVSLQKMDVISPLGWISLEDRVLLLVYSLWFYLWKTLWPTGLSPMYELTFTPHLFEGRYFVACLGVGLGTSLAFRGWRQGRPAWAVAGAAYAVAVLPVSGIVQNGYQLVALRYSYLPALPLSILAGGLLAFALERSFDLPRSWILASACTALGALSLTTGLFLPVYRNSLAMWTRAVHMEPACVICSDSLLHQQQIRPAVFELSRLVTEHPDFQEQRWHLAIIEFIRAHGKAGEAHLREYLQQVADRDPGYIRRIEVGRQNHAKYARRLLSGEQAKELATFEGSVAGLAPEK